MISLSPLAGLSTLKDAQRSDWSVNESVTRLKRLHYCLKRLCHLFTARLTAEPVYELKTAFSYHAYLCSEHVTAIRKRVSEMREPPLGLEHVPHSGLELLLDEILGAETTNELIYGLYGVAIPATISICQDFQRDAHPLADAPSVRIAKLAEFELQEILQFGQAALKNIDSEQIDSEWKSCLVASLSAAGGPSGLDEQTPLPKALRSTTPYQYDPVPKRDERFQDSYNAGVNPEVFLYDERFSARDKTLMMYYKRIRELDVPEMMASLIHEMQEKPWEFHAEMIRQLWDEARHAMMGEVGFAALGIDWTGIPINFTWSLNLNTQLTPQERHGVLFFIEQGLMPKTGKRYEWEVGQASGDPLAAMFQDFDWADEVLHSQIGRRWYVTQFDSLDEAMKYGDECWTKVLSHWNDYREQGLTKHYNWWPDLYRQACVHWGVQPDADALNFSESYEEVRADLRNISASG